MPDISLTSFLDFVAVAGPRRVSAVRACKQASNQPYDPRKDFYKRLREKIVAFEKAQISAEQFHDVSAWGIAEKKTSNLQDAVDHYIAWRGSFAGKWVEPRHGSRTFGELRIRINPEVGIVVNGKATAIKLHFKKDQIAASRVPIVQGLMLGVTLPTQASGVLDVRRDNLMSRSVIESDVEILLSAEATAFMSIWNQV